MCDNISASGEPTPIPALVRLHPAYNPNGIHVNRGKIQVTKEKVDCKLNKRKQSTAAEVQRCFVKCACRDVHRAQHVLPHVNAYRVKLVLACGVATDLT